MKLDHWYLIVIFLCLSLMNEAAGILAKVIAGKRGYEGPMGKSDRVVMLGIYCLLQYWSARCIELFHLALCTGKYRIACGVLIID